VTQIFLIFEERRESRLEDYLEPGETPPPGTSLSDPVTFTLMVTVVPHF